MTADQFIQYHDATLDKMLRQPAANPVSRAVLDCLLTGTGIYETPLDVLRQAQAAQQRDAHNEAIDKRKAQKRQVKKLAKDAGISPATLRRMLGRK